MRVLQVMGQMPAGGVACMLRDTVAALHETGIQQLVVTRRTPFIDKSWPGLNLPVIDSPFPRWLGWQTAATLQQAVSDFAPDLVQYWLSRAASYAKPTRCQSSLQIGWLGGYGKMKNYRNCDFFIAITHGIKRHLVESGVAPTQVAVIHTFAEINSTPALSRAEYNTPDTAPLLLALGQLHHCKGFDLLIEAVKQLPQAYLWIAGEGESRAELEQQIRAAGLDQRVRLLGWRYDREALLATADIFVMPSRDEPFGTVMAEAWAAGVPLVVSDTQGPKGYAIPEENALMVPKGRVDELAQALSRLIADRELRLRLKQGGRQTHQQQFTKQIMVNDYLTFYQRILEQRSQS